MTGVYTNVFYYDPGAKPCYHTVTTYSTVYDVGCGKTEQTAEHYELSCGKTNTSVESYTLSCGKTTSTIEGYSLNCGKTTDTIDSYSLNCGYLDTAEIKKQICTLANDDIAEEKLKKTTLCWKKIQPTRHWQLTFRIRRELLQVITLPYNRSL